MVPLTQLVIPILLSAVLVFVLSSIVHMLLPYHRTDYRRVPDEDRLMDDLRRANLPAGEYVVPHAGSMQEMSSPEFTAKREKGPIAFITLLPPGVPSMARMLTLWFLYSLVVNLTAGYVAARALGPGADYLDVFRFVGATAFAGYALGTWHQSIWYGRPWSTTWKTTFDGVVYALATAGVFGALWPS